VGGRKTYSKLEAFEWSGQDLSKVEWNFNREVFSTYNWKIEPNQDINYFYDKRAKELREKYDYIILWYSGGYDSHNILKTFIDNNLHLDEIITIFPRKDIMSEERYEYENYTSKKLNFYRDILSNTKITTLEYADMFIDMVKNDLIGDNVLYEINSKISNFTLIRDRIKKELYQKYIEKGKKVCFLFGIDKPTIQYRNMRFYSSFSDHIIATYMSARDQFDSLYDVNYEFFYWDPNSVPMMIKQSHILKQQYLTIVNTKNKAEILNIPYIIKPRFIGKKLLDGAFENKSALQNTSLYPRCLSDYNLGYFNNGVNSVYHSKIEKVFSDMETMKRNNIYRCMGLRNTWFYMSNDETTVKMRKFIEHFTSMSTMFTENDKYRNTKVFRNSYEI
jgi:hypothetical protein